MNPVPLHVLIVDDRDDDAELIARALRRGGYAADCERVATAEALTEALCAGAKWDVVLCDSIMPRLNLPFTLSLVHRMLPHLPVLVVSGRHESQLRELLESAEVSGVLSKDRLYDLPALLRGLLSTTQHH